MVSAVAACLSCSRALQSTILIAAREPLTFRFWHNHKCAQTRTHYMASPHSQFHTHCQPHLNSSTVPIPPTPPSVAQGGVDFTVFTLSAFQVIAQVGRSASATLPHAMASVFGFLQLVQFDVGMIVPPECAKGCVVILLSPLHSCFGKLDMTRTVQLFRPTRLLRLRTDLPPPLFTRVS